MPEGPEVKTIVNRLKKYQNKTLQDIKIVSGRYKKHGPPRGFSKLISNMPLKIESINCHGKFIWWEFENTDLTLWNTLGMSGWWTTHKYKHNNIELTIDGQKLYFNDIRNFGTIIICDKDNLEKKLRTFGPDILKDDSVDLFKYKLARKRKDTFIGSALLDQKAIAGVGNYIRADALYLSKVSPYRTLENVTDKEIETIFEKCKLIAKRSYYRQIGKRIEQEKELRGIGYFVIYSLEEDLKGNKVIREKLGTRMIHWVPKIQK